MERVILDNDFCFTESKIKVRYGEDGKANQ